jgi:hypothetical protein
VPRVVQEPTALSRNVEITGETNPYRLNFNNDPNLPTIGIYAQAPTTVQSVRLAEASVQALGQYVAGLQSSEHVPPQSRVVIRQLGKAEGHVVDGGIGKALACIAFLGVFLLWCVMTLVVVRFRENWRESAILTDADALETNSRQLAIMDLDPREMHEAAAELEVRSAKQIAERHPDPTVALAMRATRFRASGT